MSKYLTAALAAAAVALSAAPSAALAAEKPTVSTGGVAGRTPSGATLRGKVNPQGAATTFQFQIGVDRLYELPSTTATPIGNGTRARSVAHEVFGLAPATKYHYRIVARNSKGLTFGKDRTFTTRRQPLGLTLFANPAFIPFAATSVLSGNLSGTGNSGQQVRLQGAPYPFTQFSDIGNAQVTDGAGNFAFPVLGIQLNTQYRVVMPEKQNVISPIVLVGVLPSVTTRVNKKRVRRGRRVRFSGAITPPIPGAVMVIQKRIRGVWTDRAKTVVSSDDNSSYRRRVKVWRSGKYRVVVVPSSGAYSINIGKTKTVRLKKRRR